MDKLNPAGLISVRATLPIYLIDQVSSLQRRHAERRNGKFKKNNEDQKYTYFYKIVYWINSLFSADENMWIYQGGGNICPPSKILYEISFNFTWQNVFDIEACCNKYIF